MAIALSHIYAYYQIVNNYTKAIIFKDDAILEKNFSEILIRILNEVYSLFDMVFLGNGCGIHIPIEEQKEGQLLYRKI